MFAALQRETGGRSLGVSFLQRGRGRRGFSRVSSEFPLSGHDALKSELPQRVAEGPAVPRTLNQLHPLALPQRHVDVLVVGGGVAGLSAAITAAESRDTLVLLKGARGETATSWAQGGIAVVCGDDDDTDLHARDTLSVASGLGHPDVTDTLVREGPALLGRWLSWGGRFDRSGDSRLMLAREGGHSVARVVHAGDQTGAEIQRLLLQRSTGLSRLTVLESTFVLDLITEGGRVRGVVAWAPRQGFFSVFAGATILCTGGVGQLYRETTNPLVATGDGIAMAYRAGAALRGMEFVQFHPTVLYVAGMSRILVSETARGEGALLRDRTGRRFMPDYHPDAELAPRDIVSRAIIRQLAKVRDTHVYLDMRHLPRERVRHRFPHIDKVCREFGIDITRDLIPVHPACHYMVGGIMTDEVGRTSLPGLYAAGEAASTGFHGANRMGSNSLLEGAVMGHRAGLHAVEAAGAPVTAADTAREEAGVHAGDLDLADLDNSLRSLMWRLVGIERDGEGLAAACERLEAWNEVVTRRVFGTPDGWVLVNKMLVGWLIARSASARTESRGTHFRRDHDAPDDVRWLRDLDIQRPPQP
jgi:L-aspartate oxidase